jgi:hypothetical protein
VEVSNKEALTSQQLPIEVKLFLSINRSLLKPIEQESERVAAATAVLENTTGLMEIAGQTKWTDLGGVSMSETFRKDESGPLMTACALNGEVFLRELKDGEGLAGKPQQETFVVIKIGHDNKGFFNVRITPMKAEKNEPFSHEKGVFDFSSKSEPAKLEVEADQGGLVNYPNRGS